MNLSQMKTTELLAVYNKTAKQTNQKTIKRFADKKSAIRRTKNILKLVESKPATTSTKSKFPLGIRSGFKPDRTIIELKKKNTLRSKMLPKLLKGVKEKEILDFVEAWHKENKKKLRRSTRDAAYELVRIFHFDYGYGLDADELKNGKLKLYTKG
jgi:hypothetical protein